MSRDTGPAEEGATMQDSLFNRYDVILADPAWSYSDRGQSGSRSPSGAAVHYDTMTDDQIAGMNVADLAADDSLLFLWVTGPQLPTGLRVMEAWGFAFRTVAFTWVKTGRTAPAATDLRKAMRGRAIGGGDARAISDFMEARRLLMPRFAMGQGSYTRANPEYVLLGKRGAGVKVVNRGVRAEVLAPRTEHSAKPVEVHERIEALLDPGVRRLELFARTRRHGWDAWGNQVDSTVTVKVPK